MPIAASIPLSGNRGRALVTHLNAGDLLCPNVSCC
jgi:hypothetical protein